MPPSVERTPIGSDGTRKGVEFVKRSASYWIDMMQRIDGERYIVMGGTVRYQA